MLTRAQAEKILLAIPGASAGLHYRQPAIFMATEFLTRLHHKEDAMVILTGSIEMRDVMLEAEPKLFYLTDHYRNYPIVLARLSALNRKDLLALLAPRVARIAEKSPKAPRKRTVKSAVKKKTKKT